MDECQFCRSLELEKLARKFVAENRKENGLPRVYWDATVALVTHTWTKERGKRHAGRSTDYRNRGLGYKLNFCPECGKSLKERKIDNG